jgi:nitrate reductase NapD
MSLPLPLPAAAVHARPAEWHIASLVVYSAREHMQGIAGEVSAIENAEVHGASLDTGKLVVTLEADSAGALMAQVQQIQHIGGVLCAALVYQCADTLDAMNEEVSDGHRPT